MGGLSTVGWHAARLAARVSARFASLLAARRATLDAERFQFHRVVLVELWGKLTKMAMETYPPGV